MAEKIKMRKQLAAPPLLPVPVAKQQQQQKARAFPPVPAVELVGLWGFMNAGFLVSIFAFAFALLVIGPCVPAWMMPPLDLTGDAEDAEASAVLLTIWFCCTVAQAAAATPVMLLAAHRRRRIRRALAYLVLAAAVAGHYTYAGAVGIHRVVTRPEYPVFVKINCSATILIFAVGDLVCFMALLVETDE
ncbi:unnamed protein product [Urochloa decumbens]|uniref:Uncharacterized protein n=1 Tax=Urochloa decumbens TaxID=240449 RepID=A0ABC8YWV9_9POAL